MRVATSFCAAMLCASGVVSPAVAAGKDEHATIATESATPRDFPARSKAQPQPDAVVQEVDAPRPDAAVERKPPRAAPGDPWIGVHVVANEVVPVGTPVWIEE